MKIRNPLAIMAVVAGAACARSVPAPAGATSESSSTAKSGSTGDCSRRIDAAQKEIQATFSADGCVTDADCRVVAFASRCFDACARVTVASQMDAYEKAVRHVDETVCATFEKDGCNRTVPPCVAPPPMRCEKGACVM